MHVGATDPIQLAVEARRTQTEAVYTRTNTRGVANQTRPNPFQDQLPKNSHRSGAYKRKEILQTPGSCGRRALSLHNGRIPTFPS